MSDQELEEERARFDERYSEPGYHYGTQPNDFVVTQKQLLKRGQRALVPGDGEGRNGVWLAEQGLVVTSFDPSPVGIEKARVLAANRGVSLDARVGDFASWDWQLNSFDIVVLTFVHVNPRIRKVGHAGAWSALRPGGHLILEGFSSRQPEMRKLGATGGPKDANWLFSEPMARFDFPGAEFVAVTDIDVEFEGRTHSGRCALLRVVARKPI